MTLRKLLSLLGEASVASPHAMDKQVIVVVDGAAMPWPDVTGLGADNEDTVVIEAKVFEE